MGQCLVRVYALCIRSVLFTTPQNTVNFSFLRVYARTSQTTYLMSIQLRVWTHPASSPDWAWETRCSLYILNQSRLPVGGGETSLHEQHQAEIKPQKMTAPVEKKRGEREQEESSAI